MRSVSRSIRVGSVLTVTMLLTACERPTAGEPSEARRVGQPAETETPRSSDDVFAAVAAKAPSFAGTYFDEKGVLVIRLVSAADSAETWRAVRQALVDRIRVDPRYASRFDTDRQLTPGGRRYELAKTSFATLYELKKRLAGLVIEDPEVISLDLDESRGVVVLGVDADEASARVAERITLSGLERALVEIHVEPRPTPAQALTVLGRQRPLTGGFEVGPKGCTMTIAAMRGSDSLSLQASHCSATQFALDYGWMSQNNSGLGFGSEVTDPSTYTCGFWGNKKCRRADIAAYRTPSPDAAFGDSVLWVPGRIARTTFATPGVNADTGSKAIDSANPYWTVIAEIEYPIKGEVVHKVGARTGWSYGAVIDTCKDLNFSSSIVIVCSDKANLGVDLGDSGSPVFAPYGGYANTVAFYGAVWTRITAVQASFSNFGQMKQDLGYLRLF